MLRIRRLKVEPVCIVEGKKFSPHQQCRCQELGPGESGHGELDLLILFILVSTSIAHSAGEDLGHDINNHPLEMMLFGPRHRAAARGGPSSSSPALALNMVDNHGVVRYPSISRLGAGYDERGFTCGNLFHGCPANAPRGL